MIIESFLILNTSILATKMIYKGVVDYHDTYNKIINNGLYHVTSKENALKIINDGVLNPSGYINSLGNKKTFFFAGIPTLNDLSTNCAYELNNETLYAIKIKPNHNEMSEFKTRVYNDQSIVYEGDYKLDKTNSEIVELVYDYDDNKNIIIREKKEEEYKSYTQPFDIKNNLHSKNKFYTLLKTMGISYFREYTNLTNLVKNKSLQLVNNFKEEEYKVFTR